MASLGHRLENLRFMIVISILTVVLTFIVFSALRLELPESLREALQRALRNPTTVLLIFIVLVATEILSSLIVFLSNNQFWIALGVLLLFVGSILLILTVISSIEIILRGVESVIRTLIKSILGHQP
ncbi:MAG: hypothetical protein DRO12_03595 [Thermoprotei archaeon]|nr:MAG: hypothetical protein DRO12_03595 [Thermoprotei archaeon]